MYEITLHKRLQDLHTLSAAVAVAERLEEIQTALQRFLRSWPDIEQILLVVLEEGKRVASIWPDIPGHQKFLAPVLSWMQQHKRLPLLLSDLDEVPAVEAVQTYRLRTGIRALSVLPLLSGDGCQGYLLLGSPSPYLLNADDWLWVQLAAGTIGPTLHRLQNTQESAASKEAERSLRESEARYRELFENAPNAYFSIGNDGCIYDANRQAEQLTGYRAVELIGRPVFDLHLDVPGAASAHATFAEFLAGAEIREREMQLRRADGSTVWISLTVTPIRNGNNEVVASRSVAVDVTERRSLRQMRQTLVDMLVHDLRHPLGIIEASADMLAQELDVADASAREVLDLIQEGTQKALVLTRNILDVSRLQPRQMPVHSQPLSPSDIAWAVAREVALRCRQHNLALNVVAEEDLPLAQGDPHLLARVLHNLLDNAIKFTPSGGRIDLVIRLATDADARGIVISVCDSGPGIPSYVRARLFQLFSPGAEAGSGFGLGLVFCKLAMEAMTGQIWLESNPGEGSIFCLQLPISTELTTV